MPVLAAFARSEEGRAFAMVENSYGLDPGRHFDDDVLAHNFRAVMLLARAPDEPLDPMEHWMEQLVDNQ